MVIVAKWLKFGGHPPKKKSQRALVSGIVNETSVQLTSSLNPNCMNVNIPLILHSFQVC